MQTLENELSLLLKEYQIKEHTEDCPDHQALGLAKELELAIINKYSRQLLYIQAQIDALQTQINPHFLYNTLEEIRGLALIKDENDIASMTEALALMFRYSISQDNKNVTFEQELRNLENYILIQKFRFSDKFTLRYELDKSDEALMNYRLPKLTIQPIVENALFHGIEPKGSAGRILVDAHLKTDHGRRDLQISVTDNGVGMTAETIEKVLHQKPSGKSADFFRQVGIANVNQRIQYDFGPSYGISIDSKPGVYTTMTILIPCISGAEKGQ